MSEQPEDKIEIAVLCTVCGYDDYEASKTITKWDLVGQEDYNHLVEWARRETQKSRTDGNGEHWTIVRRIDVNQINLQEIIAEAIRNNTLNIEREKSKAAALAKRQETLRKKREEKERKKLEELQAKYSKGSR